MHPLRPCASFRRPDTTQRLSTSHTRARRCQLETSSLFYKEACDLLISIAEPITRPEHIQEYRLTSNSLCAAAAIGLSTNRILSALDKFSKTAFPEEIKEQIRACTQRYGKVKLILRGTRYFIGSSDPDALQALQRDPVVAAARLKESERVLERDDRKFRCV